MLITEKVLICIVLLVISLSLTLALGFKASDSFGYSVIMQMPYLFWVITTTYIITPAFCNNILYSYTTPTVIYIISRVNNYLLLIIYIAHL